MEIIDYEEIKKILNRSHANNVRKQIICCSTFQETKDAKAICNLHPDIYYTIGFHPMSLKESHTTIEDDCQHFEEFVKSNLHPKGKLVAYGEIGLDAYREEYVSLDTQEKYLKHQLDIFAKLYAQGYNAPLLLHSRNTSFRLISILKEYEDKFDITFRGVVHSFDGTQEELDLILEKTKFFVGVNGCSFKKEHSLNVLKNIPMERVLFETDAPYCRIGKSYAGYSLIGNESFVDKITRSVNKKAYIKSKDEMVMVKGRNEPCKVVEVVNAFVNNNGIVNAEEFIKKVYKNSCELFCSVTEK